MLIAPVLYFSSVRRTKRRKQKNTANPHNFHSLYHLLANSTSFFAQPPLKQYFLNARPAFAKAPQTNRLPRFIVLRGR
jgi:hypothetical protein